MESKAIEMILSLYVFTTLVLTYSYIFLKCFNRHVHCIKCSIAIIIFFFVGLLHEKWPSPEGFAYTPISFQELKEQMQAAFLIAVIFCIFFGLSQHFRHIMAARKLQKVVNDRFPNCLVVQAARDEDSGLRILRIHALCNPGRMLRFILPEKLDGYPVKPPQRAAGRSRRKGIAAPKPRAA